MAEFVLIEKVLHLLVFRHMIKICKFVISCCGVGICVIAATLSGSGFIPLLEITVAMNLTSSSLNCSLLVLSLMFILWKHAISRMYLLSLLWKDVQNLNQSVERELPV